MSSKRIKSIVIVCLILLLIAGVGPLAWRFWHPKQPNVVVILLDTLRADHLGANGYTRDTSPNLDKFAAEFNRCSHAVTTAPWTPAATLSILTGMYVESHHYMPPTHSVDALKANAVVDPTLNLLPKVLRGNGYLTAAVSSNAWITKDLGFSDGFDQFRYRNSVPGKVVTKEARMLLRNFKEKKQPFFLYIHYLDPHFPYEPPNEHNIFKDQPGPRAYSAEQAARINLYDGEIHSVDSEVGNLLSFLKELELFDDAIIVIVADHGEQFMEHGFEGHGNQVYGTENHVPLLFKLGNDGPRGQVIDHTVSTIDIYSTILDKLRIPIPQSASLSIPLTDAQKQSERAGVFTSMKGRLNQRAFTTYDGRKLIVGSDNQRDALQSEDPTKNIIGLFDIRKDYFEEHPLDAPNDLLELQDGWKKLYKQAASLGALKEGVQTGRISGESLKQLQSLGYLK